MYIIIDLYNKIRKTQRRFTGKNCASKCKFNEQCVRNEYQFETNTHFEFTCIATDFVLNTTDNKLLQSLKIFNCYVV